VNASAGDLHVYAMHQEREVIDVRSSKKIFSFRGFTPPPSFAAAGPRIWNSFPAGIRDPTLSPGTFATLLKTYLFV